MNAKKINYTFSQDIEQTIEADVIVIGGGPGGVGAAVASARNGADTALIERYGYLGGMASAGEVSPFMVNHLGGKCLDRPVYVDWVNAMRKYQVGADSEQTDCDVTPTSGRSRMISKDLAMLAAEDICLEAGVRLVYHHTVFDAVVNDGKITEVILFSKSGLTAARAGVYIDCTGDGDLAVKAGCGFEYGNAQGNCQPMTLCFKLAGIDVKNIPPREEINRLYDQATKDGEINCPRENVLWFFTLEDDVIHFNTTRVIRKSAVNGLELSEAEIEARRQLRQFLSFLRKHVPAFANARIHSIAHHIGVRESRRVLGRAYADVATFEQAKKYPDAICKVRYPIDIHSPDGGGTDIRRIAEDDWYEIPYGCIVARDVDNLLVGGRPISVDHALHSSMRVMPPACSIGQAAGTAAAMACKRGITPPELDGVALRERLKQMGAELA